MRRGGRHRAERGGRHRELRGSRSLRQALVGPGILLASFALTTGVGNALVQSGVIPVPGVTPEDAAQSLSPTAAERLLARHHCWTDDAPEPWAGAVPTAAVVIPAGSDAPVHGSNWVGPALEHVFEGERPGLTVLGFCAR
jgi:hypothetical protein